MMAASMKTDLRQKLARDDVCACNSATRPANNIRMNSPSAAAKMRSLRRFEPEETMDAEHHDLLLATHRPTYFHHNPMSRR
jgi:hypothetical protein